MVLSAVLYSDYAQALKEEVVNFECQNINELKYCVDENGVPLTGKVEVRNPSNPTILQSQENFKNGYQNGSSIYYNAQGIRYERRQYKMGIHNGMSKRYYPNGQLKILATYRDGLLDGMVEVYDEDKKQIGKMEYKKGKLYRGYCKDSKGSKYNLKKSDMEPYQDNQLYTCGVQ